MLENIINKKEQKYYRLNNLLQHRADYNILLGERSNGKSYAVKECMLWEAYNECDYNEFINNGKRVPKDRFMFGYLRRWREEIKTRDVEKYFSDMDISKLTNGNYETIECYRGDIFFANFDENGKKVRGKQCGSSFSVNSATHYKSLSFKTIGNIIYEEFITNSGYLPHEVDNLMDIISTISRREYVRVFLIGNTISRLCPYFDEWQLTHVKTQKQGTIDIYNQPTTQYDEETGENIIVKIAVEYCENSGNNSKMFFGDKTKMIQTGVWECDIYPHLEYNMNHYRLLYKIFYKYQSFQFNICLMRDDDGLPFLYVYPAKECSDKIKRIVSDEFSTNKLCTTSLTNLTKYDKIVLELINENKIVFSDNLTGTEFYQIKKEKGGF